MVKATNIYANNNKGGNSKKHDIALVQKYTPANEDTSTSRTLSPGTDGCTFNVLCCRYKK